MTHPLFSVIIPVFNKWALTRACLESLREHTAGLDFEVIVADNASSDATATELVPLGQSLFGDAFTRLRFPENINFGPASNAGAGKARAPLLFFLNNDTLMTPGWARPLLAAMREENPPGAVGPLLLYEDNTVQHLGAVFMPGGPCHLYQGFPADHPVVSRPRRLQFITAAALMMPKGLFFQVGGFYKEYRNGFEDVELCVRIRQTGKELRCALTSVVYHLESQSPGRRDAEKHNGMLLLQRCGKDMYVDVHHHALRDGFHIFVDDMLSLSMRLTEQEELAVNKEAEGRNPAELLKIMHRHPFWITGRDALAAMLEREEKYWEAQQLRAELADLLPLRERYVQLAHAAAKTGDKRLVGIVQTRMEKMRKFREDREYAARELRRILRRAKDGNDPVLSRLYEEKFKSLHP